MSWMEYDLGVVCTLPLQVARDRLVGPQGRDTAYTDQLMKFSGRLLVELWGASWDLTHLAAIDLVQAGSLLDIGGRQVVLITADKALIQSGAESWIFATLSSWTMGRCLSSS